MEKVLDIKNVLKDTKNKKELKVTLKKNKKGSGVYAKADIKKGETVLYYMFRLFARKDFESETDCVYAMKVYDKNDNINRRYKGDIDETCIPEPKNNIPYWGLFTNEPSPNESSNVELVTDNMENNQTRNKVGKYFTYRLVAIKDIKKGEEIMWHYGGYYERDYDVADE